MKKFILISLLAMAGVCSMQAQTADTEVVQEPQQDTTQIISLQREHQGGDETGLSKKINDLLDAGKLKEALAEYAKYRETIKGGDFVVTYSDMVFYERARNIDPENAEYKTKYESAKKKLQTTYAKNADVILMELNELPNITDEDVIRVNTKVIEADSTYTNAYLDRGFALMNLGRMKEACQDFRKHPDYDKMPWKAECESYFEQEAIEKAEKEFEIYRQREMSLFESDFDRAVRLLKGKDE